MRQLGSGVSTEIANTRSVPINLTGHLEGISITLFPSGIPILPVLAEQAIEGARLIKDSQVLIPKLGSLTVAEIRISHFTSSGTNPISYTIRGEGIIIPAHIAFISRGTSHSLFFVSMQSTVAYATSRNTTFIQA